MNVIYNAILEINQGLKMKKIQDENKLMEQHKTIGMNLPMHDELMKRINEAALNSNLTKAAYVRNAIEEQLKKDGF